MRIERIEDFPVDFPSSGMSITDYLAQMEALLSDHYEDSIRTLWVNWTRLSKARREYRIQLTVFPHETIRRPNGLRSSYTFITGQPDTRISIASVMEMIEGEMASLSF